MSCSSGNSIYTKIFAVQALGSLFAGGSAKNIMGKVVLRRSSRLSGNKTTVALAKKKTVRSKKTIKGSNAVKMREEERSRVREGYRMVAGTDEAGRGPLAGPVVAACCYVPLELNESWVDKIADSKALPEPARDELYKELTSHPEVVWSTGMADAQEIDEVNILQASMLSMHRAVEGMKNHPDYVLVDGNRLPWGHVEAVRPNGTIRKADPPKPKGLKECSAVVKGDAKVFCIAAASIIAKVTRDKMMYDYDKQYPQYLLGKNKGYPTAEHMAAVSKHGPSPIHRLTFAPLKHMNLKKKAGNKKK